MAKQTKAEQKRIAAIRQRILAALVEHNPEGIVFDGFEDAFIGFSRRCGQNTVASYSYAKCIEILMKRDGMTQEEAVEFFEFNTVGGWLGENTPVVVEDINIQDIMCA